MKVLKCDICKEEFAEESHRFRTPRYEIRFFEDEYPDEYPIGRIIDLCPECEANLFKYLDDNTKEN